MSLYRIVTVTIAGVFAAAGLLAQGGQNLDDKAKAARAKQIAEAFENNARTLPNLGAVEMTGGGKRGKPKTGFPPFPPPLEIAAAIPTFPRAMSSLRRHREDHGC